MIKKVLFCIFFILAIFLTAKVMYVQQDNFDIPLLSGKNGALKINVGIEPSYLKFLHVYLNEKEVKPIETGYFDNAYAIYSPPLKSYREIAVSFDEPSVIDKVDDVFVFVGRNAYRYSKDEIKNFEKKGGKFIFPKDIKYSKHSSCITDRGAINTFGVCFLSLFYNFWFYIIPYVFILLCALIYAKNKELFNFKFNLFKSGAIFWIGLLALFLRLGDLDGKWFWCDELFSASIAGSAKLPLNAVFMDYCNPPLFYCLTRAWESLFGTDEFTLRLLPCLASVLTVVFVYYFVKRNLNKNAAILTSFLLAINPYSILQARELRAYSLASLLAVCLAILFFEIKRKPKNSYFVYYGILAALIANTHHFGILYLVGNFVLSLFIFDNKSKVKFFMANFFAALAFLPYFLITALDKALLDTSFHLYDKPAFSVVFSIFASFFNGIIPCILVIAALILALCKYKEYKKEFTNLLFYSFYSVLFLYLSSGLFSVFRPIIRAWYFTVCFPFLVVVIALVILFPFKNKIAKQVFTVLFIVFFFVSRDYNWHNDMTNISGGLEGLLKFKKCDFVKFENKNLKAGIAFFDFSEAINWYDKLYSGEELVRYKTGWRAIEVLEAISKAQSDVLYIRLDNNYSGDILKRLKVEYNTEILMGADGILYARIIKNAK